MDEKKILLSKPYVFEGEEYTEIDMQGLHELKAKDLSEVDKIFVARGNNIALSGLNHDYAMIVAHRVAGKPIEFFEGLPAKDATALKTMVIDFLYD